MSSPITQLEPGEHLQRKRRVSRTFTDNHGRRFYAEADAVNQRPIGELVCLDGQLPWQPPMRFIQWHGDGDLSFTWDYQAMADELISITADYYDKATETALNHNIDAPEIGGELDRRLRAVLGAAPLSPEVPLQAQAGEPWLIGKKHAPKNTHLYTLLMQGLRTSSTEAMQMIKDRVAKDLERRMAEQPAVSDVVPAAELSVGQQAYREFMAEGRSRGMSMADIAAAWAQHKANIAEAA